MDIIALVMFLFCYIFLKELDKDIAVLHSVIHWNLGSAKMEAMKGEHVFKELGCAMILSSKQTQ